MNVQYFLMADFANSDIVGKLNIIGSFNNMHTTQFPMVWRSLYLVAKFQVGLGEFGSTREVTVKLLDEDANELWRFSNNVEIPAYQSGLRPEASFILEVRDLEFPRAGRYQFSLFIENDEKESLPIDVVQLEQR